MCTLVLLNYNDSYTVKKYISDIKDYKCFDHIVIVDNCSTDDSYRELKQLENGIIDVIQSESNKGYGYGNNFGIRYAARKYGSQFILISNPDVVYEEHTIERMESMLKQHEDVGVISTMMKMSDGSVSPLSAWKIPSFWQVVFINAAHPNKVTWFVGKRTYDDILSANEKILQVDCVPGSLLMVNRHHMETAEMYDENIFLFGEETVLGMRMKKHGFKTLLITDDLFIHFHSVSIKKSLKKEEDRMRVMWDSRKYILDHYYGMNFFKRIFVDLYSQINIKDIAKRTIRKEKRRENES
jgi:N-acetylglucosaminyl-diphospho-decaprenol L-rhamnosyltransferase